MTTWWLDGDDDKETSRNEGRYGIIEGMNRGTSWATRSCESRNDYSVITSNSSRQRWWRCVARMCWSECVDRMGGCVTCAICSARFCNAVAANLYFSNHICATFGSNFFWLMHRVRNPRQARSNRDLSEAFRSVDDIVQRSIIVLSAPLHINRYSPVLWFCTKMDMRLRSELKAFTANIW